MLIEDENGFEKMRREREKNEFNLLIAEKLCFLFWVIKNPLSFFYLIGSTVGVNFLFPIRPISRNVGHPAVAHVAQAAECWFIETASQASMIAFPRIIRVPVNTPVPIHPQTIAANDAEPVEKTPTDTNLTNGNSTEGDSNSSYANSSQASSTPEQSQTRPVLLMDENAEAFFNKNINENLSGVSGSTDTKVNSSQQNERNRLSTTDSESNNYFYDWTEDLADYGKKKSKDLQTCEDSLVEKKEGFRTREKLNRTGPFQTRNKLEDSVPLVGQNSEPSSTINTRNILEEASDETVTIGCTTSIKKTAKKAVKGLKKLLL